MGQDHYCLAAWFTASKCALLDSIYRYTRLSSVSRIYHQRTRWMLFLTDIDTWSLWFVGCLVGYWGFISLQPLTSKGISEWVLTCDGAHSWRLYSAALLGNQAISIMTWYPTQSHYPDTEPTSSCTILSTWVGSDKSLVWLDPWVRIHDLPHVRPVLYRFGHHAPLKARGEDQTFDCRSSQINQNLYNIHICYYY